MQTKVWYIIRQGMDNGFKKTWDVGTVGKSCGDPPYVATKYLNSLVFVKIPNFFLKLKFKT